MSTTSRILKRIQETRLYSKKTYTKEDRFSAGYLAGLDRAEQLVFEEHEKVTTWVTKRTSNLWQTGTPTECGDYIVILKAHYDGDYGVKKDGIYITTDFWDTDYNWESFVVDDDTWEVLYFAKLNQFRFQIPEELGIERSDEMFMK